MDKAKNKDIAVGILLILGSILVLAAKWNPPGSKSAEEGTANQGTVTATEG
jgi:hypothetical protein